MNRRTINHSRKKKKGFNQSQIRCPYCGSHVVFRSADGIYKDNSKNAMLYVCAHYPECDAYVRAHDGSKLPMGTLANHDLRVLRRQAHFYFDQLYMSGLMTKKEAYEWLSDVISGPMSEAHIGHLGEYYCKVVIEESKKLLNKYNNKSRFFVLEGGVGV